GGGLTEQPSAAIRVKDALFSCSAAAVVATPEIAGAVLQKVLLALGQSRKKDKPGLVFDLGNRYRIGRKVCRIQFPIGQQHAERALILRIVDDLEECIRHANLVVRGPGLV